MFLQFILILLIVAVLAALLAAFWAHKAAEGGASLRALSVSAEAYEGGAGDLIKDLRRFPASKFENMIRATIEGITGRKFPTVLPSWLKTPNNVRMELDGYNEELGLAFEAQGPLHTIFDQRVDKSYVDYFRRIMADEWKIKKCASEGIGLIVVDYKVPKYLLASYLKARIWDLWAAPNRPSKLNLEALPLLKERPMPYIEPIHNPPFRNIILEREMGLNDDLGPPSAANDGTPMEK